ncbi:MAG TPA: hypothetical protein VMU24_07810 [Candidatus Acidoferrales bacterium]|nr:hypothetical protein [Candidatus Acidoferrales bacterium]
MFVQPRSAKHDFAVSLALALAVVVVERGITAVAVLLGANDVTAHILDDVLTGVFAGIAMFVTLRVVAHRRVAAIKRLHDIGEMNHHVRNALQVIRLSHFTPDEEERVRLIEQASERIEFALKEFNV